MTTTTLRLFLLSLLALVQFNALSQNFITRWELQPLSGYIEFKLERGVGGVDYFWETIPAGSSGSGNFPEGDGPVSLTNLPPLSSIRLSLAPENLKRFYEVTTSDNLVDVEAWGTANWTSMEQAFRVCNNLQITATDTPDLSNVTNLSSMFRGCTNLLGPLNIDSWNTSNVTNLFGMFEGASAFNQPMNSWNTSNVTNMSLVFSYATSFDQPLSNWNTSNVTTMGGMFQYSSFNQPIGNWITNNVQILGSMFSGDSSFNQDISTWNTSSLTATAYMFNNATSFNQPIGNWNISGVSNLMGMFLGATNFNQDISSWNTSNVIYMNNMFRNASSFNQDISSWDVSNVQDMYSMFLNANSFNQSLSNWNLNNVTEIRYMLSFTGMDCDKYSSTLIGWEQNSNTPNDLDLGANDLEYSPVAAGYRGILINDKGWIITGDVQGSTNCTLSLSEDQISSVNYYPNPVEDHINIESEIIVKEIIISDLLGNSLVQKEVSQKAASISLNDFTTGYYLMKIIKADSSEEVVRILKL